jgi:hypothetical protein
MIHTLKHRALELGISVGDKTLGEEADRYCFQKAVDAYFFVLSYLKHPCRSCSSARTINNFGSVLDSEDKDESARALGELFTSVGPVLDVRTNLPVFALQTCDNTAAVLNWNVRVPYAPPINGCGNYASVQDPVVRERMKFEKKEMESERDSLRRLLEDWHKELF